MRLPGLVDVHVHMRDPGGTHKEDWSSGTAAALAGGITTVLAMPNTSPAVTNEESLHIALAAARGGARCDYGQYVVGTANNRDDVRAASELSAGLKLYLDATYGRLLVGDLTVWMSHIERWPRNRPLAVHAEGPSLAAVILLAEFTDRPVHLCHVSRADEIRLIRIAKERGIPITCEVTPHHLFLCEDDIPMIGEGLHEVRPRLATRADREALWANLDVVDCFSTDHAPHLPEEKRQKNGPPGFPGLETALPLLLEAVHEGRLSVDTIIDKMSTAPRRIFGLPEQPKTWIEVDPDELWEIGSNGVHSRCGWTPFTGRQVHGRIRHVVLRGETVFQDGEVLADPGTGRNVRQARSSTRGL